MHCGTFRVSASSRSTPKRSDATHWPPRRASGCAAREAWGPCTSAVQSLTAQGGTSMANHSYVAQSRVEAIRVFHSVSQLVCFTPHCHRCSQCASISKCLGCVPPIHDPLVHFVQLCFVRLGMVFFLLLFQSILTACLTSVA